jgi:hypothetical protein
MFCCVVLVRIDVSEERIASIIRVTTIGELGTTLAVTSKVCVALFRYIVPSSPILATLMMKAIRFPKRRFLLEPQGTTSQKTAFLMVNALKISNLANQKFIKLFYAVRRQMQMAPSAFDP